MLLTKAMTEIARVSRTARAEEPSATPAPAQRGDVFISFAMVDRALVAVLDNDLTQRGYSTWCAAHMTGGQGLIREINDAIKAAKAVIVLWTPESTKSEWVIGEAEHARVTGRLVPVRTPDIRCESLPLPFNGVNTLDYGDWRAIEAALGRLDVPRRQRGSA